MYCMLVEYFILNIIWFGRSTYESIKMEFVGVSRGSNVVEKYYELRQVYGVRYPTEDY